MALDRPLSFLSCVLTSETAMIRATSQTPDEVAEGKRGHRSGLHLESVTTTVK